MGEKEMYCKPTFLNIPPEKREKILAVAVNEFAYNGFENANINVIAKKAEVSVGSLYKYFDTKKINKLLEDHKNGKKDCYKKVWAIYTFIVWYNQYFEEA